MKKKTGLIVALVAVVCLGAAVYDSVFAWNTGGSGEGQGAIVIHDAGPCNLPGADANGNILDCDDEVPNGEAVIFLTNDNKIMVHCLGENVCNFSGKTQVFKGFACGFDLDGDGSVTPDEFTFDTHAVVTKKGRGSLKCTFDPIAAP